MSVKLRHINIVCTVYTCIYFNFNLHKNFLCEQTYNWSSLFLIILELLLFVVCCVVCNQVYPGNVITWTSMINVCVASTSSMDTALHFLQEMQREGIAPDLKTYNVLLAGCKRMNDVSTARRLIQEMQDRRITGGSKDAKKTQAFKEHFLQA